MQVTNSALPKSGLRYGFAIRDAGTGKWIREGADMARRDPAGVANSIAALHDAETASLSVVAENLKAEGRRVLEERDDLNKALEQVGFNPARQLSERQQGRIDLAIAIALALVNIALAVFVLLAFGPVWLAPVVARQKAINLWIGTSSRCGRRSLSPYYFYILLPPAPLRLPNSDLHAVTTG